MTLQGFLRLTRRRLGTILACTLLGIVVAAGLLVILPTQYSAQSTAYVRVSVQKSADGTTDSNSYFAASQLATQKVKAFVTVFTSQSVAQSVIKQLDLDITPADLTSRIEASNAANSLTIVVTATGDSPQQARRIADAVVNQSATQVKRLEGENSPVQVVMMAPASLSEISKSPSVIKYLAAGVLAGLLIGYALAFARQYLDTRLRTTADITSRFTPPVLAVLPQSKGIARTTGGSEGDFQSEESLRKLRTNLRYTDVDHQARVILVTSPLQGDGKSSVASSLAKVMAIAGDDVVLVDADLRRPSVAETYGMRGPLGLLQVLIGTADEETALRPTAITGLSVLPAFDTPPGPSELLGSTRMAELVTSLARSHVVILDAPPVLPVTDAVVLSHLADAVVIVAASGHTRAEQLNQAISSIESAQGKIAGIVLNRASSSRISRLRYGDAEYSYEYSESKHAALEQRSSSDAPDSDGARTASRPVPRDGGPSHHAQSRSRHVSVRPAAPQRSTEDISETRRMPVVTPSGDSPATRKTDSDTYGQTSRPLWRGTSDRS